MKIFGSGLVVKYVWTVFIIMMDRSASLLMSSIIIDYSLECASALPVMLTFA